MSYVSAAAPAHCAMSAAAPPSYVPPMMAPQPAGGDLPIYAAPAVHAGGPGAGMTTSGVGMTMPGAAGMPAFGPSPDLPVYAAPASYVPQPMQQPCFLPPVQSAQFAMTAPGFMAAPASYVPPMHVAPAVAAAPASYIPPMQAAPSYELATAMGGGIGGQPVMQATPMPAAISYISQQTSSMQPMSYAAPAPMSYASPAPMTHVSLAPSQVSYIPEPASAMMPMTAPATTNYAVAVPAQVTYMPEAARAVMPQVSVAPASYIPAEHAPAMQYGTPAVQQVTYMPETAPAVTMLPEAAPAMTYAQATPATICAQVAPAITYAQAFPATTMPAAEPYMAMNAAVPTYDVAPAYSVAPATYLPAEPLPVTASYGYSQPAASYVQAEAAPANYQVVASQQVQHMQAHTMQAQPVGAFEMIDQNHDGQISRQEFATMFGGGVPQGFGVAQPASYGAPTTTYGAPASNFGMPGTGLQAIAQAPTITNATCGGAVGSVTCPSCSNVYMADSNFCRKCGTRRA
eukprot:TRINITY_DN13460_c0_g1_i2.p1 TRINITY_DN13460_c0_g1~~TRINITY_DN13460_c0_g1_i2.p1  ORF type:complete len:515 (-),score=82.33 TRINITY_DN13460_c0_g1_i2:320-1864(-)